MTAEGIAEGASGGLRAVGLNTVKRLGTGLLGFDAVRTVSFDNVPVDSLDNRPSHTPAPRSLRALPLLLGQPCSFPGHSRKLADSVERQFD